MKRRITWSAIAAVATLIVALPIAHAMDSKKVQKGGPDLTSARALIEKEQWDKALNALRPLARSHPNSADVFNLIGYSQRKSGQFDVALQSYQRALKLDPKHLDAHVYLGELYIQTKQLDKAVAQSKIIARLCPKGCKPRAELEAAMAKAKW